MDIFIMLVAWVVFIWVVKTMAEKRNRNVVFWVMLGIFLSPLLSIIVLAIIGDDL